MPYVVQQLDPLSWRVSAAGNTPPAEARAWLRPDRRCVVRLPSELPDVWGDLAAALAQDAGVPLLASAPAHDDNQSAALSGAGFRRTRLEQHWLIRVAPALDRLTRLRIGRRPEDDVSYDLVSARHTDLTALCALDNQIRQDIPGTSGWAGTVTEMAESLDDGQFDPALYVVARRQSDGAHVGLVRVWNRSPHPRVGCLGVVASLRRTSLCLRLVLAVGTELRLRGVEAVTTETDVHNAASHTLVRRMGGQPTGLTAQWERPAPPSRSAAAAVDS
ncbi:MAG: GNAT family N-acetyltransferase [Ornithinimicrobium sp.]|uniref:GNAT family N-acetyltransferase n=1 Tax=Ornithinimicrobium sp. TaxID=1977084 RepID=UPI00179870E5|nr:GNAT family N-acetyltransferase [Actinomycetota bacterium]